MSHLSWLIITFLTRLPRRVPLLEHWYFVEISFNKRFIDCINCICKTFDTIYILTIKYAGTLLLCRAHVNRQISTMYQFKLTSLTSTLNHVGMSWVSFVSVLIINLTKLWFVWNCRICTFTCTRFQPGEKDSPESRYLFFCY